MVNPVKFLQFLKGMKGTPKAYLPIIEERGIPHKRLVMMNAMITPDIYGCKVLSVDDYQNQRLGKLVLFHYGEMHVFDAETITIERTALMVIAAIIKSKTPFTHIGFIGYGKINQLVAQYVIAYFGSNKTILIQARGDKKEVLEPCQIIVSGTSNIDPSNRVGRLPGNRLYITLDTGFTLDESFAGTHLFTDDVAQMMSHLDEEFPYHRVKPVFEKTIFDKEFTRQDIPRTCHLFGLGMADIALAYLKYRDEKRYHALTADSAQHA